MSADADDLPRFDGPIVQWPKYGATYRGESFIISPVPTDDGRWLLSINDWTDYEHLHSTVIAALDAALGLIKDSVDRRTAGSGAETGQNLSPVADSESGTAKSED